MILHGLQDISNCGLLHGDIKAGNILVDYVNGALVPRTDNNSPVVIIDFGLSRIIKDIDGLTEGTPGFCAPEQCVGKPVIHSDIYAAGILLAYILLEKNTFWNCIYRAQKTDRKRNEFINKSSYSKKVFDLISKMIKVCY